MLDSSDIGKRVELTFDPGKINEEIYEKGGYITIPSRAIKEYHFLVKIDGPTLKRIKLIDSKNNLELRILDIARKHGVSSITLQGDIEDVTDSYVKIKKLPLKRHIY